MVQFSDLLAHVKLLDGLPKIADAHHHPLLDILQHSTITEANLAARIAELLIVKPAVIAKLLDHFPLNNPDTFYGVDRGNPSATTNPHSLPSSSLVMFRTDYFRHRWRHTTHSQHRSQQ